LAATQQGRCWMWEAGSEKSASPMAIAIPIAMPMDCRMTLSTKNCRGGRAKGLLVLESHPPSGELRERNALPRERQVASHVPYVASRLTARQRYNSRVCRRVGRVRRDFGGAAFPRERARSGAHMALRAARKGMKMGEDRRDCFASLAMTRRGRRDCFASLAMTRRGRRDCFASLAMTRGVFKRG